MRPFLFNFQNFAFLWYFWVKHIFLNKNKEREKLKITRKFSFSIPTRYTTYEAKVLRIGNILRKSWKYGLWSVWYINIWSVTLLLVGKIIPDVYTLHTMQLFLIFGSKEQIKQEIVLSIHRNSFISTTLHETMSFIETAEVSTRTEERVK